ncbi:MAG: YkgJ family cysteine cluster protein [Planctomycetia bacterium]|nr:YkgJ family cysteine cluster protein [Planctomycetia bacterium]
MTCLPVFECDGCGACCRTFPIYVTEADAILEPRIHQEGCRNTNSTRYPITLFPLPFHEACCFLDSEQRCAIYSTRPGICRELAAGSEQCQQARQRQGLPELLPSEK